MSTMKEKMHTGELYCKCCGCGHPCRVMREINEHDKEFYFKERRIEIEHEEKG